METISGFVLPRRPLVRQPPHYSPCHPQVGGFNTIVPFSTAPTSDNQAGQSVISRDVPMRLHLFLSERLVYSEDRGIIEHYDQLEIDGHAFASQLPSFSISKGLIDS